MNKSNEMRDNKIEEIATAVIALEQVLAETRRQLELVISHINDRAPTIQDTVGGAKTIEPVDDGTRTL